jgi:hypothetical protein
MAAQAREKKPDFDVLEKAADSLREKGFEQDERTFRDLKQQWDQTHEIDTDYKYYLDSHSDTSAIRQVGRLQEFPERIRKALDEANPNLLPPRIPGGHQPPRRNPYVKYGLLPEIDYGWLAIKSDLYLWDYSSSHNNAGVLFYSFNGNVNVNEELQQGVVPGAPHLPPPPHDIVDPLALESTEIVVSVALVTPRPETFSDKVAYVLVVALLNEVRIFALTISHYERFNLEPTKYSVATDGIQMRKIVGSCSGRIFMAGDDGNMHELVYKNHVNNFLMRLVQGSYKCMKTTHGAWVRPSLLVPALIRNIVNLDDELIDIVLDDARGLIFCASKNGWIFGYFMGGIMNSDSKKYGVKDFFGMDAPYCFCSAFNLPSNTRDFITRYHQDLGHNMTLRKCRGVPTLKIIQDHNAQGLMTIKSLHIIPPEESQQICIIAVLANGLRVYMEVSGQNGKPYCPHEQNFGQDRNPKDIKIAFVRSPVPKDAIDDLNSTGTGIDINHNAGNNRGTQQVDGKLPSLATPGNNLQQRVDKSFYKGGVWIHSNVTNNMPKLFGTCEDLTIRHKHNRINGINGTSNSELQTNGSGRSQATRHSRQSQSQLQQNYNPTHVDSYESKNFSIMPGLRETVT